MQRTGARWCLPATTSARSNGLRAAWSIWSKVAYLPICRYTISSTGPCPKRPVFLSKERLESPPGLPTACGRPPPCRGQYLRTGKAGSAVFPGSEVFVVDRFHGDEDEVFEYLEGCVFGVGCDRPRGGDAGCTCRDHHD